MVLVVPDPNIEFHLTGGINGATNANPFMSRGGQMAALIQGDKLDNLWDPVSTQEQAEGSEEYRWIVIYNKKTETIKNPHLYFLPKDTYIEIEFSRLAVSAPVSILEHEYDRPPEEEIGPEQDVPMPFEKSTEDYGTTLSVGPDIPPQGKLYVCLRRIVPQEAPSENRAYTLVLESQIPQVSEGLGG